MTPLVQLKKQFSPFGFVTPRALVSLVFCAAAGFIVTGRLLAFFHLEAPTKIFQRTLTLADRVAYQQAIEDVYCPLFPPANPVLHTAVWTGSEMIVWGGHIANSPFETNTGGRYNPGTDSWTTTSTATQYNGLVASLRDVPVSGSRPGAVATFVKTLNHSSVPWVSVMAYGAKADDSHDDTDAFNKAIADAGPNGIVYVPAGTYKILGQIELNGGSGVNWPARLIGAGNKLSALHITSAALAIQTVGTIQAARGASVSDLRFFYDQPDVTTYGTFNQYKPVIYVNQLFVFRTALEDRGTYFHRGGRYERLRIERAWDGITCVAGVFQIIVLGRGSGRRFSMILKWECSIAPLILMG